MAEAYQVVLGRRPTAAEIVAAREQAVTIARLYAPLLSRSRAA